MRTKKNGIPVQEYELVSICRQTIEGGIALVCEDCGRVIFNIAIIKGKNDGKTYQVGLTCVKKLLNKTIYFSTETQWEYERQLTLWNEAFNTFKWLEKKQKQREKDGKKPYVLELNKYTSEEDGREKFYFKMQGERAFECGFTKTLDIEYINLFNSYIA